MTMSRTTAAPIALVGAAAAATLAALMVYKKLFKNKSEKHSSIVVTLPQWAQGMQESLYQAEYKTDEDKMALAIELASLNVQNNTGGPFGCAIFEYNLNTNKSNLVSIGMNRVVPLHNSTCHGEVVAIQFAQAKMKAYSLLQQPDNNKSTIYELYTSCEPCCMCLGATLWSGVSRLICSATKTDAGAIGFDEGPVFPESYTHLEKAGIEVVKNVLNKQGAQVLQDYGKTGLIYNR